jgi:hypothetical protein
MARARAPSYATAGFEGEADQRASEPFQFRRHPRTDRGSLSMWLPDGHHDRGEAAGVRLPSENTVTGVDQRAWAKYMYTVQRNFRGFRQDLP